MLPILTATQLARLRGQSCSYVCSLCRLPPEHPKHIQNEKITATMYVITDPKVLDQYPGQYFDPRDPVQESEQQ